MASRSPTQERVTTLLVSAETGGAPVWDQLVPLVYDELRALARAQLSRGGANTLGTTELVHEAYLRLVDATRVLGQGRGYFFGAAARAMRQILVDRARRRGSAKRGGGAVAITLEPGHAFTIGPDPDLIELDAALRCLEDVYPRAARVVECRFFGGLDTEETAETLGVSPRTVKRDWALARAWLYREMRTAPGVNAQ